MNRQVASRSSPLLADRSAAIGRRRRLGEVAGGTAADCAAVWCCFPCAAVNVLVLALYKVPASLCRRAWALRMNRKKKKGKRIRMNDVVGGGGGGGGGGVLLTQPGPIGATYGGGVGYGSTIEELERRLGGLNGRIGGGDDLASAMEEEEENLWGRFSTSGFWRNPSDREDDD